MNKIITAVHYEEAQVTYCESSVYRGCYPVVMKGFATLAAARLARLL